MEFTVRKATLADMPRIQELNLALFLYERQFGTTYSLDWTYSADGVSYFTGRIKFDMVFVAEYEKQIIGYISGKLWHNWYARISPELAELENMFVEEAYRSQGVGSALAKVFIDEAKKRGTKILRVFTMFHNSEAIKFYKKIGFEEHSLVLEQLL